MHVGPDQIRRIVQADVQFTAYNTRRTFRVADGAFEIRRFGGATALRDPTRADAYYNRVVGLGEADLAALDDLIAFHHAIGKPSTIALTPDRATPALLGALRDRGYALTGTHSFFAARCDPAHGPPSPHSIRRAGPADLQALAALWSLEDPAPIPEDALRLRGPAQWTPEFPIYLIEIDDQPAAMATMFLCGGVAWLGNANTAPALRGRGCQRALLDHRIREAARMGCDLALTDTEFGGVSHRNAERAGLHMAYVELTLTGPQPASASSPASSAGSAP